MRLPLMNSKLASFLRFHTSLLLLTLLAGNSSAVIMYDQNVTNNVIFGTGNANGAFTVDRANGIELGLRAKLRFDDTNQPDNIFNSDGAGTYTFDAGLPPSGFGFAPGSSSTATWNFEWSINSNYDGSTMFDLDDLVYIIGIDFDPGAGTSFLPFDPINALPLFDHAIGDNTTAAEQGAVATDATDYAALISQNNLAQNSWNMEFFDDAPLFPFDGRVSGIYDFQLRAFSSTAGTAQIPLASTSIQVRVVPEPTTLALMGLGIAGLGFRRKTR